jgi:hypothetical protein
MSNILINPNSGIIEFTTGVAGGSSFTSNVIFTGGSSYLARLSHDNFGGLNIVSYTTGSGIDRFSIDGNNGRLFSVTDNLSGSLFSVNDIAGLPIIEAFDDNTVIMGAFNKNDFILSGNSLGLGGLPNTGTMKLYVSGNIMTPNNIEVSGTGIFNSIDLNNIDNLTFSGVDITITNGVVALTNRPTVNGTGILLSGEAASLPTTIVYATGDQTISGTKTFPNSGIFETIRINKNRLLSYDYQTGNFNITNYLTIINCPLTGSGDFATGILPSGNISGSNFFVKNINICPVLITGSGNYTIDNTPNLYIYSGESVELLGVTATNLTGWYTMNTNLGLI